MIQEKKEEALKQMQNIENDYYRMIRMKEELSFKLIELDNIYFKEKTELDNLSDIIKEKEINKQLISNKLKTNNNLIKDNLISMIIPNVINDDNNIQIKLKNDLIVLGNTNNNNEIIFNKLIINNQNIQNNLNEIYEKNNIQYPDANALFIAYNI